MNRSRNVSDSFNVIVKDHAGNSTNIEGDGFEKNNDDNDTAESDIS